MSFFGFLFLSELGTCSQKFMPMGGLKNINFHKGCAEIHI
jgi:hypothetical protein